MTDTTSDVRPGPQSAPRRMVTAMLLLTVAIALSWQALARTGQPTQAVAWGSTGLAVYAASLLCLLGGARERWFGLSRWWFGSWILLWYGIAFGLATLTWTQPQTGTSAEISLSSVLRALWLVAAGMTLWTLGYSAGPGWWARHFGNRVMAALSRRFTPEVRSPLAPWILYGIATVARIVAVITTGLFGYVGDVRSAVSTASGYQHLVSLLSLCGPLAVAAAALQVYRERTPGARVTLTILFLAEIAFGVASGGKQSFIITILAVAVPFTTARRRVYKGLLVFAVVAFLLVIVPFNQAYRSAARNASGTLSASQAIEAMPGILKQIAVTGDITGVFSSSASYVLTRIREIDSPAIIMQRTPSQIGFLSPVQLAEAPVVDLVPRAVWPDKPILDTGYQFSQSYFELPPTVYTSSAVTPVGDLYRHGGWIPVIVGMFLLGCATRFLDDVMDVRGNPHSIFLFLLLFTSLVKQEDDFVGMLAGIPGILLVWLFAVYVIFRRKGPASNR
jgi:hypothetical protein